MSAVQQSFEFPEAEPVFLGLERYAENGCYLFGGLDAPAPVAGTIVFVSCLLLFLGLAPSLLLRGRPAPVPFRYQAAALLGAVGLTVIAADWIDEDFPVLCRTWIWGALVLTAVRPTLGRAGERGTLGLQLLALVVLGWSGYAGHTLVTAERWWSPFLSALPWAALVALLAWRRATPRRRELAAWHAVEVWTAAVMLVSGALELFPVDPDRTLSFFALAAGLFHLVGAGAAVLMALLEQSWPGQQRLQTSE